MLRGVVMGRGRGRVVADIEGEDEMTRVADVEMEGAVRGGCK